MKEKHYAIQTSGGEYYVVISRIKKGKPYGLHCPNDPDMPQCRFFKIFELTPEEIEKRKEGKRTGKLESATQPEITKYFKSLTK